MATRRQMLSLMFAAAALPLPACSSGDPLPDPIAAWRNPGAGQSDPRLFALAHAILAPNPHNRQPWLVELIGADEMMLWPDLQRLLPDTDPYSRQISIGCGAMLELLSLAAAEAGYAAEITPFPEGGDERALDQRPFAHVKLIPGGVKDPLFAQILARRTNREPYEDRTVPESAVRAMIASAQGEGLAYGWSLGGGARDQLRQLVHDGFHMESHTPAAHMESIHLLRVGKAEIARHRDGIAVEGAFVEVVNPLGLLRCSGLRDPEHLLTKPNLDQWLALAVACPGFVWMRSAENTRLAQIAAGRAYARLNLAATREGLAMHPWSQALQEYPEMAALYRQAETLTGATPGARTQMLVRVGYGPQTPPAPRRGLGEHLRA